MADATYAPTRPQRAQANLSAVPYMPGLDGMRAIAVVAVMLYHANHEWLPGGFLGVEVFFVISGYLITLLLMAEREKTGGINLLAFWGRRAQTPAAGAVRDDVPRPDVLDDLQVVGARQAPRRPRRRLLLRLELVPDLGRAGVHGGQRLRAAAPPLEPRRRGAVLRLLADHHAAADAAPRHAAAGDDRPLAGRHRARDHACSRRSPTTPAGSASAR